MFDATYDDLLNSIYGLSSARKIEYGPEGHNTGTGSVRYTTANNGTDGVFLVSYQIQGTVSDMVSASLEFQISGDLIRDTLAFTGPAPS
jgi:hypothetical protein